MPFNTRNPIPSGDLRDLDDNARNIDTWANDKTKLSHPDRFGVERYTWHGIEKKAQLDIEDAARDAAHQAASEATVQANDARDAAFLARDQAIASKIAAANAAAASGVTKYADTKAILTAGIGTAYVNGDVVLVFTDESHSGASAVYKIESNSAVFKTLFDQTRADLLRFTGNISADAEWSDVPAHSDPAFDAQAQALANRTELVRRATLVYPSYAEILAAAPKLPIGQIVDSLYDEMRYTIDEDHQPSDERPIVKENDYSKVRSYTGRGTRLKVVDSTGAHYWVRRGTTADNGGTVLKDASNRSWVREFSGRVNARWFGAGSGGDDTDLVQAAVNAHPGSVIWLPRGSYSLNGAVTATVEGTTIEGDGTGCTYVSQRTPNTDSFVFKPTTAGSTNAYLNQPAIRNLSISHGVVSSSSTIGAGVRFVQCNGHKLFNVTVNNAPEGITLHGGQFGSLKSFQIFASDSGGMSPSLDTALLYLRQAQIGDSYQPCYTTEIEDFRLSASKRRDTCILIRNADGVQFVNGYLAYGNESLVKLKAERDNSYISNAVMLGVYMDCVGPTHTNNGVVISEDGFENTNVYGFKVGAGCSIGNGRGVGVLSRKARLHSLSINADIMNMGGWAVDVQGSDITDIEIESGTYNNIGNGSVSGAVRASNGRSIKVNGVTFKSVGTVILSIGGTFASGTITGNTNAGSTPELGITATFSKYMALAGNSGADTNPATSWSGVRTGNVSVNNPETLDYYLEGVFTPTMIIGGSSDGVAYAKRVGVYTRIGNIVHYSLDVTLSSKGSSSGNVEITGLPFASANHSIAYPAAMKVNTVSDDLGSSSFCADVYNNSNAIRLTYMETSGATEYATPISASQINNASSFVINGFYRC